MPTQRHRARSAWILTALCFAHIVPVPAAPPTLYRQPNYQSPVRGEPDDLLLIAGYGLTADDVVVYQATGAGAGLATPPQLPGASSATTGIAPIVSTASIPYALTVRLPQVLRSGEAYALWVHSKDGWSEPVAINDARPLWITPAQAYATRPIASLPRYLRVVGRNLQPAPGAATVVRLSGPHVLTLTARDQPGALARYVAEVDLPPRLAPGEYRVEVSRDGVGWVSAEGQRLVIRADPRDAPPLDVSDFGCRPDDGKDDVRCIAAAIRAATSEGRTVELGPGTWDMIDSGDEAVTHDGILVPVGVSLSGAGKSRTTVLRHASWGARTAKHSRKTPPSFTLQGRNRVQNIRFKDERRYTPADLGTASGILQLGKMFYRATRGDPGTVADVVIAQNVFDRPIDAISNGGEPIERLFIVHNEFGAYATALNLGGNRYNVGAAFRLEDSVIAHNLFKPGSYVDASIQQGSTASHIGGSRRVDFSDNVADGAATEYLQQPQRDQRGWRAAFFWHMAGSHEMVLVSRNTATCTGDKAGDGEAIAYDANVNTFAFGGARAVLAATADSVSVTGALKESQDGQGVDAENYYVGHWVRVVDGPGVGQIRRIDTYATAGARLSFDVSPRWDVVPTRASRVSVAREYWQVHTVDNLIDHRRPPCRKSNRNGPEGGEITLYAPFADSAVEGNRQYDTDGITVHQSYNAEDPACPTCKALPILQSFVDVRGNTIEGEYAWMSDCSQSGILVSHSAAPTPSSPPPVVGFGLSIAHNSITHADGVRGGAITIPLTWLKGPPPYHWKLLDGTLVHHNAIRDLTGNVPLRRCDNEQKRRIGINLYEQSLAWGTVLYANTCSNVAVPLVNRARGTVVVCPSSVPSSCECAGGQPGAAASSHQIGQ